MENVFAVTSNESEHLNIRSYFENSGALASFYIYVKNYRKCFDVFVFFLCKQIEQF